MISVQLTNGILNLPELTMIQFQQLKGHIVEIFGILPEDQDIESQQTQMYVVGKLLANEKVYKVIMSMIKVGNIDGQGIGKEEYERGGQIYTGYMDILSELITFVFEQMEEKKVFYLQS